MQEPFKRLLRGAVGLHDAVEWAAVEPPQTEENLSLDEGQARACASVITGCRINGAPPSCKALAVELPRLQIAQLS